jgi:DAK2 domain fusion protein YloV
MLATAEAALAEVRRSSAREHDAGRVTSAAAEGALMGARGNSGVILSQILRGAADALDGHRTIDGASVAAAFARGSDAAYAALGTPVEGTILTVVRAAARGAAEAARSDGGVEPVLAAALEAAERAVAESPALLPVLREAGVVDAGGQGLVHLIAGMLGFLRGAHVAETSVPARPRLFALVEHADDGFGYETMFLLRAGDRPLEPTTIRDRLEALGGSVLVAGDSRAVKVHIHNDRPDEVLSLALSFGRPTDIPIEDLDAQAREMRDARAREVARTSRPTRAPAAPPPGVAVVAVAPGPGFAALLESLGATAIVRGGATRNPSAGDLVTAIRATDARHVIVLPNDRNVRLAAEQAAGLCPERVVSVVSTRDPAEGVAALLAFDPRSDPDDRLRRMTEVARGVTSAAVTVAVRDARSSGRDVRRGQTIVLGPDGTLLAAADDETLAVEEAMAALPGPFELVTLYRGQDVPQRDAEALAERLRARFDAVEVEIVDGGQPHYGYFISAE